MTRSRFACSLLVVVLGCGDDRVTPGGAGGGSAGGPTGGNPAGGSPTGGAPTGGAPTGGAPTGGESVGGAPTGGSPSLVEGDCKTDTDCPPDGSCIEIEVDGYRVCQYPVIEATECSGSKADICCSSLDCRGFGEKCLLTPITAFCAGIKQEPHNQCAGDQCASDADCDTDQICAPAGTLGNQIRVCLAATCHGTTCGVEMFSPCAVIRNPCCGAPLGLFCATGCLTDADCPDGYCDIDPQTQESVCTDGAPICPS